MLSVRQLALRSLLRPVTTSSTTSKAKHTLPDLTYDYNALEPVISAEIMQLHHSKHHQTYVNMYNVAEEKLADAVSKGITKTVVHLSSISFIFDFNSDQCLVLSQVPKFFVPVQTFSASPKIWLDLVPLQNLLCRHKKQFYWMQIIFYPSPKFLWLPQYVKKFLVWHKKFGPAQNSLGPVKRQGINEKYPYYILRCMYICTLQREQDQIV